MARKLLIDVMSTNDKGLIGFTETGEEVPLSAPKAGVEVDFAQRVYDLSSGEVEHIKKEMLERVIERLRNRKSGESETYFMVYEPLWRVGAVKVPYNLFTRRKI